MPKGPIPHVKQSLHITWGIEEVSYIILETAKEIDLIYRKGPSGIAAAACRIASVLTGGKIPLSEIAEIAEVTEETIRNRCDELVNYLMFTITL